MLENSLAFFVHDTCDETWDLAAGVGSGCINFWGMNIRIGLYRKKKPMKN
jgi:hypothetical protein